MTREAELLGRLLGRVQRRLAVDRALRWVARTAAVTAWSIISRFPVVSGQVSWHRVRKSVSTTTWPCQAARLVTWPVSVVSGRFATEAGTGVSTTVPR